MPFSGLGDEHNVVDIGPVHIENPVVLLTHVSGHEISQWIFRHETGRNGFVHFGFQFFQASQAFHFFLVFTYPDRQGYSPVPGTAQIPVLQVFQPIAKSACAGGCRFPVDGLVE